MQLDALFRRQLELAVGAIGLKDNAVVGEFAIFGILTDERIGLKPTRISEDGIRPAAHLVQTA